VLEAHAGYLMAKREARVIPAGQCRRARQPRIQPGAGTEACRSGTQALAVLGVSDAQMEAISFGEEKPRNEADTEAAYAENRRTDVVYGDE
jgi:peptidoglycan-associated lipoprotein